ncbi:MAG: nuclease-related domain-containing protein [Cyanobacteria bacterium J06592_8]
MKNHNQPQAGEFVRQMSVQRRQKAIRFYGMGLGCLIGGVLFLLIFKLSGIGLLFALVGGIASYGFWQKGEYWMRRSEQALMGAKAEQEVAVILNALSSKSSNHWQIEYNFPLKRWGDADVVLCSSEKNWYVVDVKSHKGKMINQDNRLKRVKGRRIYDFSEGDLLSKVRGQAADVARLKQVRWVTPILCFTQAQVKIPRNQIDDVYIVEKTDLIRILEDLEKRL